MTTSTQVGRISEARRGFTLVEVMVAVSLCGMLTLAALTSFLFTLRGERALTNYSTMNATARKALEQMGRDFRSAGDIPSGGFSSTSVTLKVPQNAAGTAWQSVVWSYDPGAKTVTRTINGTSATYATNVVSFVLSYFNAAGSAPSNDIEIKQVQLSMRILNMVQSTATSEYVISAQFTLRAKSTTV